MDRDRSAAVDEDASGASPEPAAAAPAAVVPAAGASRRMGRPKPLLAWGDRSVVGSVIEALRAGGCGEITLVVAPGDDELARWGEAAGLAVAENPRPERGMLSSVLAGVERLGGAGTLARRGVPLLVTPADLPALAASTVRRVLAALAEGAALAVPTHAGRRGHPLGISPPLLPELPALDPAIGLRQLLDRHAADVREVQVADPGAVEDVDTPDDYRRLRDASLRPE